MKVVARLTGRLKDRRVPTPSFNSARPRGWAARINASGHAPLPNRDSSDYGTIMPKHGHRPGLLEQICVPRARRTRKIIPRVALICE